VNLEGGIGSLILGERAVLCEFSAGDMLTEDLEARNIVCLESSASLTNVRASRSVQNSCIRAGGRGGFGGGHWFAWSTIDMRKRGFVCDAS
jgi:hypothetical protein